MKTLITGALAAIVLCTGGVAAQERLLPRTQFDMTSRITVPDTGEQMESEMRYREGIYRTEMTMEGVPVIMLLDMQALVATTLVDMQGMRMALEMPLDAATDIQMPTEENLGDRIGSDRVAGEACTIYRIEDEDLPGGEAHGCLTDDYVLLRLHIPGQGNLLEATRFARRSQDASLFTVPAGYQRMQMPAGVPFGN